MTGQKKSIALLMLCLIAGTLDAIAAILMTWKYPATTVFKYIAGGWFGTAALKGGTEMVVWGVLFHYVIASIYSCIFFFLYPGFKRVIGNKIAIAIIIGVLIWGLMKFIVLPLTNIPKSSGHEFILDMLIGAGVLCITLGAPIVIIANRYYSREEFDRLDIGRNTLYVFSRTTYYVKRTTKNRNFASS